MGVLWQKRNALLVCPDTRVSLTMTSLTDTYRVADSEARKLSNEVRQAITDYMAVIEHKVPPKLNVCINTNTFTPA